jgi:hypothetical protein
MNSLKDRVVKVIDAILSLRVSIRMKGAEQNPFISYLLILIGTVHLVKWLLGKFAIPWIRPILK